jgi:hypothetical protein
MCTAQTCNRLYQKQTLLRADAHHSCEHMSIGLVQHMSMLGSHISIWDPHKKSLLRWTIQQDQRQHPAVNSKRNWIWIDRVLGRL